MKKGCCMCGYNLHPRNLTLDHLPEFKKDKSSIIKNGQSDNGMNGGGMLNLSFPPHTIRELIEEVRKCRVICNRCDGEHNFSNNQLYRQALEIYNSIEYYL